MIAANEILDKVASGELTAVRAASIIEQYFAEQLEEMVQNVLDSEAKTIAFCELLFYRRFRRDGDDPAYRYGQGICPIWAVFSKHLDDEIFWAEVIPICVEWWNDPGTTSDLVRMRWEAEGLWPREAATYHELDLAPRSGLDLKSMAATFCKEAEDNEKQPNKDCLSD